MNVLLACIGIFSEIGGGQRFYSNLIQRNPEVQFYFFGDGTNGNLPPNAHALRLGDEYRRSAGEFGLDQVPDNSPAAPIRRHSDELALLLDMAAAAPLIHFDVVDLPDFLPLVVYFPECLKYFGIEFDRIALSMHGTLSMGLFGNWDESIGGLESLVEHEELLYRYSDLRYGIGRRYVDDWAERMGLPAQLLDITKIYALSPHVAWNHGDHSGAPDLCFIGRQEKWKGPDLFLELCSRLPRDSFGNVRLFGPTVNIHGKDSMEALCRLARNRSLDIQHEVVSPDQIATRMRNDRMVVVLPSRRDTFNLVALEALLSGCPTAVSTQCGVVDFLDTAYPGLPYVKIDPDDLLASYDGIVSLLTNYDAARRSLVEYLSQAKANDYGALLPEVYATEIHPDLMARDVVGERFRAFSGWLATGFLKQTATNFAAQARARCVEVLSSYNCSTISPEMAEQHFWHAVDVNRIWTETMLSRNGGNGWVLEQALPRLNGYVFGGSRINLYRLMAEWERARGNDLLFATYWLRVMRLSGQIPQTVLHDVQAILAAHGFHEEARAAEMLYRNDEDEIYRYLQHRADSLRRAPNGGLSVSMGFNRPESPRVSVIVSVYNGAGKVDTFVSGLERFTSETKAITEFIFIDSASPDDTHTVLTERLKLAATRGLGSLYLRSEQRETIQRAWNRGIDASRGLYLAFLGVDEMDRPDGLAKLAAFLDRRQDIDWVQGSAVITEVNASGSYVRDVMAYDRRFDAQHIHYLECCYISYVGALYRKSIHDRVGLYDDQFRGAGDTEFKNRALPFIRAETLPETFGTFLNYPEERTTQSPTAEIEDLRAWYLHRTAGGIRYAFERRSGEECIGQFRRALHYKKSYMEGNCTDVDYALNLATYLQRYRSAEFIKVEHFIPNLLGLQLAYQRLDIPALPKLCLGLGGFDQLISGFEHAWFAIAQAHNVHKLLGMPAEYRVTNDNRWHQHHILWPSKSAIVTIDPPAANGTPPSDLMVGDVTVRLTELTRDAIATIIRGQPIAAPALGALCSLSTATKAQEILRALIAKELARTARQHGVVGTPRDAEAVMEDVSAILGSYFGTSDASTAILCPPLSFAIVDEAGRIRPARTEAAIRHRGGSWRVPLLRDETHERLRIHLDATLDVVDHPGLIQYSGFYSLEGSGAGYRWTGPETSSSVTIPVALTNPAHMVIELGSTGKNVSADDFTVSCNGKVVSHSLEFAKSTATLRAYLPPSRLVGPSTKIGLTVRNCSKQSLSDLRALGVVFRSLALVLGAQEEAEAVASLPGTVTEQGDPIEPTEDVPSRLASDAPMRTVDAPPHSELHHSNGEAVIPTAEPAMHQRALVIDDSVPETDKDAGSNAILQHILSLQRVGYKVSFIPADNMARIDPYTADLEQCGTECFYRPLYTSVDDVLEKCPTPFDVVYLHRCSNAFKYIRSIRQRLPRARILYSVADLHFLRLERQGEVQDDDALREKAEQMRHVELESMSVADCVIVHSTAEAALLKELSPGINVHVVPWTIELREKPKSTPKRPTLAFIGGYRHPPNVDAARWAVECIMPPLRKQLSGVELLLVGSHMPREVETLALEDVLPVGYVPSLDDIFSRVHLTIAPLRYGAGLKGKVLDSMAAGIPCVMTSIAAEGLNLPAELQSLVADEPNEFCQRVTMLCRDARYYRRTAKAGQAYIGANYSAQRIDSLIRKACGLD